MSQLISYKIPSVIHENLYSIYKDHMKDIPVQLYNNNTASFGIAVKEMIKDKSILI